MAQNPSAQPATASSSALPQSSISTCSFAAKLGPRTQTLAHALTHALMQTLAPGCIPVFTRDGLNLYFYSLTARFGTWVDIAGTKKRECPLCHRSSVRIHSRYTRHIADNPWSGIPFKIRLRVRRFFCDNAECRRHIFTERLDAAIAPYARRTRRLGSLLEALGCALGGRPGAPLTRQLGMPTSPTTLVRLLRRMPD